MNGSFIMLLVLVVFLGAGFGGSFVGGVIYGQNQAENAEDELSPRLGAGGQFPGGGQGANAGQRGQGRQGQSGGQGSSDGGAGNLAGGQGRPVRSGAAAEAQMGTAGNSTEGAPATRQAEGSEESSDSNRPGRATQNESPNEGNQPQAASGPGSAPAQDLPGTESDAGSGEARGSSGRAGVSGSVLAIEGDTLTVASPRGDLAVMLSDSSRVFQVSETGRESLAAEASVRVVGSRNPDGGIAAQSVLIVPEGVGNLFGGGGIGGRARGQGP